MSVPSQRLPPRAPRPDGYTEWGSFGQQPPSSAPDRQQRHDQTPRPRRAPARNRPRRLAVVVSLLVAATATVLTGLVWPGWLTVTWPVAAAPATPPPATALTDRFVAALSGKDAATLDAVTCRTGTSARHVEQRVVHARKVRACRTGDVDTTAGSMALTQLAVTVDGARVRYRGVLAHIDNRWCVVGMRPLGDGGR